MRTTYGMTETSGGCVYDGEPMPGVTIRAVDWDGRTRLAFNGPTLMTRYLDAESPFFEEGGHRWLVSGDLGIIRASGKVEVSGRADDVITSGGLSIAPGPLRRAVRSYEGISDAWILGTPDEKWGQIVTALVVPKQMPSDSLEMAELGSAVREHAAARIGRAQAPRRVVAVEDLPYLGFDKIDRAAAAKSASRGLGHRTGVGALARFTAGAFAATTLVAMATVTDWIEGARLRTLPAAAAPVIVGSAAAHYLGGFDAARACLALVVALALQVGVNYANDYSDGIRGTDDNRQGPARLTGGGLAKPRTVLGAALGCFALAGVAGLALVAVSGTWWLIAAGAAAVVAAWFYTGGKHPYAYMGIGLSELMVFVFFGLLACVGTSWTQVQSAPWWLWVCASALGLLSVALLMANNIRDIPTDRASGKMTAAVRLGDRASRWVFAACVWVPVALIAVVGVAIGLHPLATCALGVGAAGWAAGVSLPVLTGASGRALIAVLRNTGFSTLAWALLAALALVLS